MHDFFIVFNKYFIKTLFNIISKFYIEGIKIRLIINITFGEKISLAKKT